MLAYQISVNGKHVTTAGVDQGLVSAIANWASAPKEIPGDWHAGFSLAALDSASSEYLKWFRCDVQVGDEIRIKLVETERVDEPTQREPRPEKTLKA